MEGFPYTLLPNHRVRKHFLHPIVGVPIPSWPHMISRFWWNSYLPQEQIFADSQCHATHKSDCLSITFGDKFSLASFNCPLGHCLIVKTHLEPTNFFLITRGTSCQVPFFFKAFAYSIVSFSHLGSWLAPCHFWGIEIPDNEQTKAREEGDKALNETQLVIGWFVLVVCFSSSNCSKTSSAPPSVN